MKAFQGRGLKVGAEDGEVVQDMFNPPPPPERRVAGRVGVAMIRRFAPGVRGLLALAALLIGVPAFAQSAAIASTTPSTLNQANLRTAVIAVNLTGATYESSADTSHFTLNTTISGLSVNRLWFNSGRDGALLYLQWDGSDFDAAATISVTVAAAATNHNAALTTSTVAVGPARWVNVSTETVALAEGGGAGTYTVVLESTPTGNVTLTVTSDNAAVTVDSDATPLTRTLTFTTMNWATAQTVTVTPVDDNSDTVDEVALVTNVATGGGYSSSTTADRTVRVTVADDDARTGTDYDADDDQLIEIDSLAKLNAVRWDLDGDGTASSGNATTYAAAFPGAAAGMGCPDSGDADALGNCGLRADRGPGLRHQRRRCRRRQRRLPQLDAHRRRVRRDLPRQQPRDLQPDHDRRRRTGAVLGTGRQQPRVEPGPGRRFRDGDQRPRRQLPRRGRLGRTK